VRGTPSGLGSTGCYFLDYVIYNYILTTKDGDIMEHIEDLYDYRVPSQSQ
jgi:hypothetical protein